MARPHPGFSVETGRLRNYELNLGKFANNSCLRCVGVAEITSSWQKWKTIVGAMRYRAHPDTAPESSVSRSNLRIPGVTILT